ncbi:MAG TPA: acyloxyacyl hydrolase [Spirochaetota bacterium]|jgi:hypothetical protein|nr:MAG: Lipid A 3-O-deacylase (PagL) [Spirochaetes bacterium ADurb.Bin133]HPY87561.1 acyloxyacyl hydrolase [Spirochaetota bacterium]HQB60203.1 acyloxyacyl hydrolase [Spirochaetota bacterium]
MKNIVILIFILFFNCFVFSNDSNKKDINWDAVHNLVDISHRGKIGGYASFDSTRSGSMDINYGVSFQFFRILKFYYIIDFSFESNIFFVFDEYNKFPRLTVGFGLISCSLRFHIIPIPVIKCSLFIEGIIGLVIYTQSYPDNGTNINGMRHLGGGIEYYINDYSSLFFSLLWFHTSNNDVYGRERNPSLNSIGLSIGFKLSFLGRKYKI